MGALKLGNMAKGYLQTKLSLLNPKSPEKLFVQAHSVSEARRLFSHILSTVDYSNKPVLILDRGRPKSVVLSIDQYAGLMEDRQSLQYALEALEEHAAGETISLAELLEGRNA